MKNSTTENNESTASRKILNNYRLYSYDCDNNKFVENKDVYASAFPVVIKSDGIVWDKAALYLNALAKQRKSSKLLKTVGDDLLDFLRFMETHNIDMLYIPIEKELRVTYRYRQDLLNREKLGRNTAAQRISRIVAFYEYCFDNNLFTKEELKNSTREELEERLFDVIIEKTQNDIEEPSEDEISIEVIEEAAKLYKLYENITPSKKADSIYLKYNEKIDRDSSGKIKFNFICLNCNNPFWVYKHHINSAKCPECNLNESAGENYIKNHLLFSKISFEEQKKYSDLRNKNPLSYDFFLPKYNLCIEFDGEQHYKPLKIFGGKKKFFSQIKNDIKKNLFCFRNKINLLRIPYFEFSNIETLINQAIHKISNEDLIIKSNSPIFNKVSYISFIAIKRRRINKLTTK